MNHSMVPQGLMAPMMALPYDVSGMSTTPSDVQRPGPVTMSTLASALASATPENQRLVSYFIFSLFKGSENLVSKKCLFIQSVNKLDK